MPALIRIKRDWKDASQPRPWVEKLGGVIAIPNPVVRAPGTLPKNLRWHRQLTPKNRAFLIWIMGGIVSSAQHLSSIDFQTDEGVQRWIPPSDYG